jgi:hypothetical protein
MMISAEIKDHDLNQLNLSGKPELRKQPWPELEQYLALHRAEFTAREAAPQ